MTAWATREQWGVFPNRDLLNEACWMTRDARASVVCVLLAVPLPVRALVGRAFDGVALVCTPLVGC